MNGAATLTLCHTSVHHEALRVNLARWNLFQSPREMVVGVFWPPILLNMFSRVGKGKKAFPVFPRK